MSQNQPRNQAERLKRREVALRNYNALVALQRSVPDNNGSAHRGASSHHNPSANNPNRPGGGQTTKYRANKVAEVTLSTMDADLRHVVTPATNLTERALKSDGAGEMITVRVDEVWAFGRLVSYRNIQVRRPHLTDAQIDHIWNNR